MEFDIRRALEGARLDPEKYALLLKCVYHVLTSRNAESLHIICGDMPEVMECVKGCILFSVFPPFREGLTFSVSEIGTANPAKIIFTRDIPSIPKCRYMSILTGQTGFSEEEISRFDRYGFIEEIARNPMILTPSYFRNFENDFADYGFGENEIKTQKSLSLYNLVWGADRIESLPDSELPGKLNELLGIVVPNRYYLDDQITQVFSRILKNGIPLDESTGDKLAGLSALSNNKVLVDLCADYTVSKLQKMPPSKLADELKKLYGKRENRESYTFGHIRGILLESDNGKVGLKAFYEDAAKNTLKEEDAAKAVKALSDELRNPECSWFSMEIYTILKDNCMELIKRVAEKPESAGADTSDSKSCMAIADESYELLRYVFSHDESFAKEALTQVKDYFMARTEKFAFSSHDQRMLESFYGKYLQVNGYIESPGEKDLANIANEIRGNLRLTRLAFRILEAPCVNFMKNKAGSLRNPDEAAKAFDEAYTFIAKEVFKYAGDLKKYLLSLKKYFAGNRHMTDHIYVKLAAILGTVKGDNGEEDSFAEFADEVRAKVAEVRVRGMIFGILEEKCYRKYREQIVKKTAPKDLIETCEKELEKVFSDCPTYKDNCLKKIKHDYWDAFKVEDMDMTGDNDFSAVEIAVEEESGEETEKAESARRFAAMSKQFKDGEWVEFCTTLNELLPMKPQTFTEKKAVIEKITADCLELESQSSYITKVNIDDYYYLWFLLAALNEEEDPLEFLIKKRLLVPARLTPDVLKNYSTDGWWAVSRMPTRYKGAVAFLDYLNERKGLGNKVIDESFKKMEAFVKSSRKKGFGLFKGGKK